MALIIDGIPVSGSQGYSTYSRNRFGAYKRNRVTPVNPNSTRQNAARAIFRDAVAAWVGGTVDSTDKGLWTSWADATPWLNAAGQSVRMTALNAWIRYYAAVFAATGAVPTDNSPPLLFNLGALDVTVAVNGVSIDTGDFTVDGEAIIANNTWQAVGGFLLIEASKPTNPGNAFPGGPWSSVMVIPGSAVAIFGQGTPVVGMRWPVAIGQQVWLRVRGVAPSTDRRVSAQQILGPFIVSA